jgi:hypothetical protein
VRLGALLLGAGVGAGRSNVRLGALLLGAGVGLLGAGRLFGVGAGVTDGRSLLGNVRLGTVLLGTGLASGLGLGGTLPRLSGSLILLGTVLFGVTGLLFSSFLLMVLPGVPGCVMVLLGTRLSRLSLTLLGRLLSARGRRNCSPCGLNILSWLFDKELPGRSLFTTLTGLTGWRVIRDTSVASGPR